LDIIECQRKVCENIIKRKKNVANGAICLVKGGKMRVVAGLQGHIGKTEFGILLSDTFLPLLRFFKPFKTYVS